MDAFSGYDALLAAADTSSPWERGSDGTSLFRADHELLGRLLTVPVAAGEVSESGRFARGIDAWLAHQLRRAGFGADEVWPRPSRPRVYPRELAELVRRLPRGLAAEVEARVERMAAVAPVDARVLGRAYEKQVDVCIARWERGPELLISTKAMVSSFAKNLANRFEEAYGDAHNLRSRYPLAAIGFVFVMRDKVLHDEPEAYERALDMVRKLRDEGQGGYTATALLLVGWDTAANPAVTVDVATTPQDAGADAFLAAMVRHVMSVTPVQYHVRVRELAEGRDLSVEEGGP